MIKRTLFITALGISSLVNANNLSPKLIIGVGGFVSSDKSMAQDIGKQVISHFKDVYVGVSIYNKVAIYTNETFLNKGYDVRYNFDGVHLDIHTRTDTTGVLIEPYQNSIGNHEVGLGVSINRNRRYINNDISTKVKYNSVCAELLYNYLPMDLGFRTAYCPSHWTSEESKNINVIYTTLYKRW